MGIPHLTTLLRPHALPVEWEYQGDASSEQESVNVKYLIIDGPSLAHFIYHKCHEANTSARNAFQAIPTYAELGQAVVSWLRVLENFGLQVKHIFFDGLLPQSKIDIRFHRLQRYLEQLTIFRSLNADLANINRHATAFDPRVISSKSAALPAPPFLVPVVTEALLASQYSGRTAVVPCEADVQCSEFMICDVEDIVLTSDSDLIIQRPEGRIIFFNDLQFGSEYQPGDKLKGLYYTPSDLSLKFDSVDLMKLGYHLKSNPHLNLEACAERANRTKFTDREEEDFALFSRDYIPRAWYSHLALNLESIPDHPLHAVLKCLDPRVSELIHQAHWGFDTGRRVPPHRSNLYQADNDKRHMYLPFLIDDPVRASAWRASLMIRQIAYSVLAVEDTSQTQMMEVDRRGDRIIAIPVQLIEPSDVVHACVKLEENLHKRIVQLKCGSSVDRWQSLGILGVLEALREDGRNLPPKADAERLLTPSTGGISWNCIYFRAQVEGLLYSLRMLHQILEVCHAARPSTAHIEKAFGKLQKRLDSLPPLHTLHTFAGSVMSKGDAFTQLQDELSTFYDTPGNQENSPHNGFTEVYGKKKKGRKTESDADRNAMSTRKRSKNVYDILGDM